MSYGALPNVSLVYPAQVLSSDLTRFYLFGALVDRDSLTSIGTL